MTALLVASTGRQHDPGAMLAQRADGTEPPWVPDGVRHAYLPGDGLTLCGLNVPWQHPFSPPVDFGAEPVASQCPGCRLLASSLGYLAQPAD